jgi:hypothetical protein
VEHGLLISVFHPGSHGGPSAELLHAWLQLKKALSLFEEFLPLLLLIQINILDLFACYL